MERFPMGFWNYTTNELTADAVNDWVELGMTMANSPEITDNTDRKVIFEMLDKCQENNIKMIMCDHRGYARDASIDPETYETKFRAAYEEFGKHPAVFGFFVSDEPTNEKQFSDCIFAHKIQLKVAPELTPFLNLHPYHRGHEKTMLNAPSFGDWAKNMIEKSELKILSYDRYTQLNSTEEGIDAYFMNLRLFHEAAKQANIPAWTTLLSTGHLKFRCPSENDLRWQLSTAVVSGMQGIMWFFIYERENCRLNCRLAPFDVFGKRTETFNWMARTNGYFMHQYGDFFNNAKFIETAHVNKAYGGYDLFEPGKLGGCILDVKTSDDTPAIVSMYEHDGKKWFAVVNNSQTDDCCITVHFSSNIKSFKRFVFNRQLTNGRVLGQEDHLVAEDWYFPGQIRLFYTEQ